MISIKNLDFEYITALVFGILGFVLSLFIGFISGNNITLLFVRSLVITIIFSMIGFACLMIVKKFVPEIYQVFSSINENKEIDVDKDSDSQADPAAEHIGNIQDISTADVNTEKDQKVPDMELENEFNTMKQQSASVKQQSAKDINIGSDKLESEVISKDISSEKNIKYEPKIAAQAIRTMMKRDE